VKRTRATKSNTSDEYDFRAFLQERLRASSRRNASFSLRAFARQLGINHSTLSQILRGKRRITPSTVKSLGRNLGLPEETIENYAASLQGNQSSSTNSIQFDLDTFQLLAVWYHQAILELTHTKSFRPDSRWIARILGITVDEVNVAIQRLLRLGLLEMSRKDRWIDRSGDAEFYGPTSLENSNRLIEREVHELAVAAIDAVLPARRIDSQMIFAFNSKQLPQLRRLTEQFVDQVRALVAKSSTVDDVYYTQVSIFPITKLNEGEK
jgi:transcriptional regulator with XRE-family HTH domain